jgi:hypothetical protein
MRSLLLLVGLSAGLSLSEAQASPLAFPHFQATADQKPILGKVLERNDLCVQAHLEAFAFVGLKTVPDADYCGIEVSALPATVRESLERIILVQKTIARVLELPEDALFGATHRLVFRSSDVGSIASVTLGREVTMAVLPDWTIRDFPAMMYAHEVIHVLSAVPGPFAEMTEGLTQHPLLSEALPNLIAAVVFNSPAILLGESALPPSLRSFRDATPTRSLNEPFRNFYLFADLDAILGYCRSFDLARETSAAALICARAEASALSGRTRIFSESELAEAFRPEHCLSEAPNGLVFFDRCDPHPFSYPLVSLFFRVRAKTGRHSLGEFLRQLSAAVTMAPVQECRFFEGTTDSGSVPANLKSPSLADVFRKYRSTLSPVGRTAFDLAWQETAFRKYIALDHLYRTRVFNARAALAVAKANDAFAEKYGCGPENLEEADPVRCRVECREKTL